jgi:hypothetical protein
MRRISTFTLLSLLCVSLQAQLISFDALKNGVFDVTEIKKELILNGFTKVTTPPNSNTDTYAYNYNETEETASIRVSITPVIELENAGLYEIDVQTSGDYIHDELVKEITEKCTFEGIGKGDELVYSCDYATFVAYSQGGNNTIMAYPNFEQLTLDSPIMPGLKELLKETMTEGELEEFIKAIEENEEEK